MLRAIHLFPQFPNIGAIHELRAKYDPLHDLIPPHITLVFPFDSTIDTDILAKHVKDAAAASSPFQLTLAGITGSDEEYLFLNVKFGNDQIIELHDRLYTGLLHPYLNRTLTYVPHLTVGRLNNQQAFQSSIADTQDFNHTFETTVREIIVEKIDADGHSSVESIVPL